MSAFLTWFAMQGYAAYIWPAYGVVFFVLTMNVLLVVKQRQRTRQLLRQWLKRS